MSSPFGWPEGLTPDLFPSTWNWWQAQSGREVKPVGSASSSRDDSFILEDSHQDLSGGNREGSQQENSNLAGSSWSAPKLLYAQSQADEGKITIQDKSSGLENYCHTLVAGDDELSSSYDHPNFFHDIHHSYDDSTADITQGQPSTLQLPFTSIKALDQEDNSLQEGHLLIPSSSSNDPLAPVREDIQSGSVNSSSVSTRLLTTKYAYNTADLVFCQSNIVQPNKQGLIESFKRFQQDRTRFCTPSLDANFEPEISLTVHEHAPTLTNAYNQPAAQYQSYHSLIRANPAITLPALNCPAKNIKKTSVKTPEHSPGPSASTSPNSRPTSTPDSPSPLTLALADPSYSTYEILHKFVSEDPSILLETDSPLLLRCIQSSYGTITELMEPIPESYFAAQANLDDQEKQQQHQAMAAKTTKPASHGSKILAKMERDRAIKKAKNRFRARVQKRICRLRERLNSELDRRVA